MVDPTTDFLNTRLDRYEIREKLGTGGMARVYRGYDHNLAREVAIKVLHEHLSEDPTFKERFEREARFVASINHPNIVQIFDYASLERGDSVLHYMVMQFVRGQTLRDMLESVTTSGQTLPHERIEQLMLDLCAALSYAHEKGLIHRDVKPANILIDDAGRAILTDFGIARMAASSNLTQEGITVGTPAYMSPEQATGEPLDARSDIYAAGIILYELLTGKPPFDDDGSISILLKHVNEPVPRLAARGGTDNSNLDAVISKALSKRPELRYQTADALAEDIKRAFRGQQPDAFHDQENLAQTGETSAFGRLVPVGDATTPPRRTSRSPIGILAVGLGVISIILAVGLLAQINNDDGTSPDNTQVPAEAEQGMPLFFTTDFSETNPFTGGWPQTSGFDLVRELTDEGNYRIRNEQVRMAVPTIFSQSSQYEDFSVQLRGMLEPDSSPASAYGIIFRYQDDDNYNVFAVDGLGRVSVWVRSDGRWIELRNPDADINTDIEMLWTPTEVANPVGESNILRVDVYDNFIVGSINGEQVVMVQDETLDGGAVGIYVASTEQADARAVFDMYGVMDAPTSMTGAESMTGPQSSGNAMTAPEITAEPTMPTVEQDEAA